MAKKNLVCTVRLKVRDCEVAAGQVLDDVAVPCRGAGLLHRVVVSLEAERHLQPEKHGLFLFVVLACH